MALTKARAPIERAVSPSANASGGEHTPIRRHEPLSASISDRDRLRPRDVLALQRVIGNRAVSALLTARPAPPAAEPGVAEERVREAFGPDAAIQARASAGATGPRSAAGLWQAARAGFSGAGEPLPHADQIARSFGPHRLDGVRAFVGGAAARAAEALGASAYTVGESIAFRRTPDLSTAAHEAAHVVQQRAGVRVPGGIGRVGDAYERHADAVAELVVQGRSAAPALDAHTGGAASGTAVQRSPVLQRRVDPGLAKGTRVGARDGRRGRIEREDAEGYVVILDPSSDRDRDRDRDGPEEHFDFADLDPEGDMSPRRARDEDRDEEILARCASCKRTTMVRGSQLHDLHCPLCNQMFQQIHPQDAQPSAMRPLRERADFVRPSVPYLFRCLRWDELQGVRDKAQGIQSKGQNQAIKLEDHLFAPRQDSPFVSCFGSDEQPRIWAWKRTRDDTRPVRHPFPIAVIHAQRLVNAGSRILDVSTDDALEASGVKEDTARSNGKNSKEFTVWGGIPPEAVVSVVRLHCDTCGGPCRSEDGWYPDSAKDKLGRSREKYISQFGDFVGGTPIDGNCLYHAVNQAMGRGVEASKELRAAVVEWMFVDANLAGVAQRANVARVDVGALTETIATTGNWSGNPGDLVPFVVASAQQINIVIVQEHGAPVRVTPFAGPAAQTITLYLHQSHYSIAKPW